METITTDTKDIERAIRTIIRYIGDDPEREGLLGTPDRIIRMWKEIFRGYDPAQKPHITTFTNEMQSNDIVFDSGDFYSMCEHHLVPFFGEAGIAYLPAKHGVAGFSKFTRLVEVISRRPQLQERMTTQIAEAVARDLHAEGVLVVVEAQQLCMMMRGDAAHGARTTTNAVLGRLKEDAGLREQAMALLL